jgi:hypothetical protein
MLVQLQIYPSHFTINNYMQLHSWIKLQTLVLWQILGEINNIFIHYSHKKFLSSQNVICIPQLLPSIQWVFLCFGTLSTIAVPQTKCFRKWSSFNPKLKGCEAPTQVADTFDMRQTHLHEPNYTKGQFTHSMPCPYHAPALLQQCRVLRESPRGSWKYPNC